MAKKLGTDLEKGIKSDSRPMLCSLASSSKTFCCDRALSTSLINGQPPCGAGSCRSRAGRDAAAYQARPRFAAPS